MTVVGLDDTDSRTRGMCTTYVATRIANRIAENAPVHQCYLVRLNPAIQHKTRGNAALAIHTSLDAHAAHRIASDEIESAAETTDPNTNPGLVVSSHHPDDTPTAITRFAQTAIRDHCSLDDTHSLIERNDYLATSWDTGRGLVGALAAIGATNTDTDWTYELIAYRTPDRWGTPRTVDASSVFNAAETYYPDAWDTVDRTAQELVCVPRTPGPVLYGLRGDTPEPLYSLASEITCEPVHATQIFLTNQGTDAHLHSEPATELTENKAYRVTGTVTTTPITKQGGHVFFTLQHHDTETQCVAFEPTKRFRTHVRHLHPGDTITACGEVSNGTLKLEKFAVRDLCHTIQTTPTCPGCTKTMKSAGTNQGYRCKDCGTSADGKTEQPIDRALEPGWYEVPPRARRHIAKPLIRGGFDAPLHPEQ